MNSGRAGDAAFLGQACGRVLAHRLDQAEVEQLDDVVESAALGREHVAGLDVAVDQADLMGLAQALAGLPQAGERRARPAAARGARASPPG